jgi:hypothetical protein
VKLDSIHHPPGRFGSDLYIEGGGIHLCHVPLFSKTRQVRLSQDLGINFESVNLTEIVGVHAKKPDEASVELIGT